MRRQPFEVIVTNYGPMVLRVCRAVLGPAAAEDAWSDTFLSALRAYPDLPPDSNVEAWLVTIAHRKAIDHLRAESRRAIPSEDLPEPSAAAAGVGESPDGIGVADRADVRAALQGLPLKQRQTVAYHYLGGLPYADVADIVGGTAAAARRAAADGIAALRRTCTQGDR